MSADLVFAVLLTLAIAGWFVLVYLLIGGPKLWGPERGIPVCGHPFEQTWGAGAKQWRCPKCFTSFEVVDGRWRPVQPVKIR